MRVVVDMNLSPLWRDVLFGHEVRHWSEIGEATATDESIMDWARRHGYIILTQDLDFGAILHATEATAPSVIQLRGENVSPELLGQSVRAAIKATMPDLASGAILTIDLHRPRLTLLPLGRREEY